MCYTFFSGTREWMATQRLHVYDERKDPKTKPTKETPNINVGEIIETGITLEHGVNERNATVLGNLMWRFICHIFRSRTSQVFRGFITRVDSTASK